MLLNALMVEKVFQGLHMKSSAVAGVIIGCHKEGDKRRAHASLLFHPGTSKFIDGHQYFIYALGFSPTEDGESFVTDIPEGTLNDLQVTSLLDPHLVKVMKEVGWRLFWGDPTLYRPVSFDEAGLNRFTVC